MNEIDKARFALIPTLAERTKTGVLGRTALMKYMYFLQTLKDMPLGYSFSMYSYGPFDPAVLSDLTSAETMNIVESSPVQFAGGYGYRIKPGARAQHAKEVAAEFLDRYTQDIDWLFSAFGNLNSAQLELTSTIVYIDQEFADAKQNLPIHEITLRLQEIKPHFTRAQVEGFVSDLLQKDILRATVRAISRPC